MKKKIIFEKLKWRAKPKVFGIGLSKTGTTSLSKALEILGYKNSLHWKKGGKVIGWPELFYADSAADIPCSAQFEALYCTLEDSRFIYTTRDLTSWEESIKKHYEVKKPSEIRSQYRNEEF